VRGVARYLGQHPGALLLDLGRARSANVAYYGEFSAKVFVADISEDILADSLPEGSEFAPLASFLAADTKRQFDVVSCWDLFNYLSPARAAILAAEITAHSTSGAMIYVHTWFSRTMPRTPMAFDLLAGDNISFDAETQDRIPAPGLSKTSVSKLFPHFERTQSFLSRAGLEEHLLVKRVPSVIIEP